MNWLNSWWLSVSLNLFRFSLLQLNCSTSDVLMIKTFKTVSMSIWFELWFNLERIWQINTRSINASLIRLKSMIDSKLWKWVYVIVLLSRLNVRWNSFIKLIRSVDLLSIRVLESSHIEWWMLKSLIIKCFVWEFSMMFSIKARRRSISAKLDDVFDSLYKLWTCK